MALLGNNVLLLVQTSAGPPGVYTEVGSQTGVKFTKKAQAIDVSDKSSYERKYLAGERDETITLDHLYIASDAGYAALLAAWQAGTPIVVERNESGSNLEYASAIVTQLDVDAKKDAASTVAVTLQVTGGWTAGSAP
jgi:predicted secreted protein